MMDANEAEKPLEYTDKGDGAKIEALLTDTITPPSADELPTVEPSKSLPSLPPRGNTRLVTATKTLTIGAAPVMIANQDLFRESLQLTFFTDAPTTDYVIFSDSPNTASAEAFSGVLTANVPVVLPEYTGVLYASAVGSGSVSKVSMIGVGK